LINHNELKLKTKTFDTINCYKRIKHGHKPQKQQTLYSNAKKIHITTKEKNWLIMMNQKIEDNNFWQ